MVAAVDFLVFAMALGVSVGVIVAMVAPRWQRIVRLASGHVEPEFHPLSQLVVAERRVAMRRWVSVGYSPVRQREAA